MKRIFSGVQPTGNLHLGNYLGAIRNWVTLQESFECIFCIVDLHAITLPQDPEELRANTREVTAAYLAAGIDAERCVIFNQSAVPGHSELAWLFSCLTPLGWLNRMTQFKEKAGKKRDMAGLGLYAYPVLMASDILLYKASHVPVGEDQVAHVELTREVARRFNHFYGKEADFEQKVEAAIKKMGKKNARLYNDVRKRFQERGESEALAIGKALLESQQNISLSDRDRLLGYLEGGGRIILPEPQSLLSVSSKMPGLDGQKMSKTYNNTVTLRDPPEVIEKKIRTMPTDPTRVRRTDPGDPEKCPVWDLHQVYTSESTRAQLAEGCKTASIGCLDCKQHIIDAIIDELKPIQQRMQDYLNDLSGVDSIINEGCEAARDVAQDTIEEVRKVMGLPG